jgi:hypothetical protein
MKDHLTTTTGPEGPTILDVEESKVKLKINYR